MPDFDNAKYPRVTYRIGVMTLKTLEVYADSVRSPEAMAKFLLETSLNALPQSLPTFSEPEALFICNGLNNASIRSDTVQYLRRDLEDELYEMSHRGFDASQLRDRLIALTPFEWVAVVIAVQRYWAGEYYKDAEASTKRLREVGLVTEGTMNKARSEGKQDEYAKMVGGFAVAQMSNGSFDYFPTGQPANINGDVDKGAQIVEKWFWNGSQWRKTA